MIIGQTMFSVRRGTQHRAGAALEELRRLLSGCEGLQGFRILRSVGMSPLASELGDEGREAALKDDHYLVQTEWEDIEAHDRFFSSDGLQRCYGLLSSVLTSGPYDVLYQPMIEQPVRAGVA